VTKQNVMLLLWACHAELVSASHPLSFSFFFVIPHSFPWPALGQVLFQNLSLFFS